MTLKLYNTLTRKKEVFKPIDPDNVRMYVCGPTVYDYAHVGNFRPVVVFDILYRLLRHEYGPEHVTYARNITDIDDKIIKAAADQGVGIEVIAEKFAGIYNEDTAALHALPPDIEPKATETIPEMIAMMEKLIADGHAYAADGHVLFNVPSMKNYGRLSKKPKDELIAGARVDVAPYKKDPRDFILWKPSSDDQPGWDSPWGRGRPGWHLECSCMTEKHLGETIDIHGGGLDLIFPHHENEIAQSECAHGKKMARYWVHNGYLVFGGEKMSKSVGNIKTMHGLLENFPGEALRLTLMSAHYRQPLDFTDDVVKEQKRRLDRWYRIIEGVHEGNLPIGVIRALEDDLNTPKAIAELEGLAKPETADELKAGARFLGLLTKTKDEWFKSRIIDVEDLKKKAEEQGIKIVAGVGPSQIENLIQKRNQARINKDFQEADKIRDILDKLDVVLEDNPDGTTSWRFKS